MGHLAEFVVQVHGPHLQREYSFFAICTMHELFVFVHTLLVPFKEVCLHFPCQLHADVERNRHERGVQQEECEQFFHELQGTSSIKLQVWMVILVAACPNSVANGAHNAEADLHRHEQQNVAVDYMFHSRFLHASLLLLYANFSLVACIHNNPKYGICVAQHATAQKRRTRIERHTLRLELRVSVHADNSREFVEVLIWLLALHYALPFSTVRHCAKVVCSQINGPTSLQVGLAIKLCRLDMAGVALIRIVVLS